MIKKKHGGATNNMDKTLNHLESYEAYLKNLKSDSYKVISEKKKPIEIKRVELRIKLLKDKDSYINKGEEIEV